MHVPLMLLMANYGILMSAERTFTMPGVAAQNVSNSEKNESVIMPECAVYALPSVLLAVNV